MVSAVVSNAIQFPSHQNSLFFTTIFTKTTIYSIKHLSRSHPSMSINSLSTSNPSERESCLGHVAPLEAILFDIDGTLCDSDPLHYFAFREMLQEVGFNGGVPISEEFFIQNISGKHNEDLCGILLPDRDLPKARKFLEDKEAMFRRLAAEKLEPMEGLEKLCKWIGERGLKRAAVTNAPRSNAELLISMLGLSDFFEVVIIGSECDRAKPFPDPYLKALEALNLSNEHAFIFEDSVSGIKAGRAAGMAVVGLSRRNPESLLSGAGAALVVKNFNDPLLWKELEELGKAVQVTSSFRNIV